MLKNSRKSICYFLNIFGLIWTQDMRNACLQTYKTKYYAKYGRGTYTWRTFSTKDLFLLSISVTLFAVNQVQFSWSLSKYWFRHLTIFFPSVSFQEVFGFLWSPSVLLDRVNVTYQHNHLIRNTNFHYSTFFYNAFINHPLQN